jgi:hypothetical protein
LPACCEAEWPQWRQLSHAWSRIARASGRRRQVRRVETNLEEGELEATPSTPVPRLDNGRGKIFLPPSPELRVQRLTEAGVESEIGLGRLPDRLETVPCQLSNTSISEQFLPFLVHDRLAPYRPLILSHRMTDGRFASWHLQSTRESPVPVSSCSPHMHGPGYLNFVFLYRCTAVP